MTKIDELGGAVALEKQLTEMIGAMNKFCSAHPDFAFNLVFSQYFPGVQLMKVADRKAAGLVEEKDGRYTLSQALEDNQKS